MTDNYLRWVNRFTPLLKNPNDKKTSWCDIPEKSVVRTTLSCLGEYEEVVYTTATKTYTGWIHNSDLEVYVRNLPFDIVELENQTEDPHDLEQYVWINKVKQTNLCGQICVSEILGLSLSAVLSKWQSLKPNFFKRIFGTGKARGTGAEELIELIDLFVQNKAILLSKALYQPHIKRSRYTIKAINELLDKGSIIASVHINTFTGLVQQTGALHWIRLRKIIPERNGQGAVLFYNPAMDSDEVCSYDEFIKSAVSPYGVYVSNLELGAKGESK